MFFVSLCGCTLGILHGRSGIFFCVEPSWFLRLFRQKKAWGRYHINNLLVLWTKLCRENNGHLVPSYFICISVYVFQQVFSGIKDTLCLALFSTFSVLPLILRRSQVSD